MEYDVWFSRYDEELYFTVAHANEPPEINPRACASVAKVLARIREKGLVIAQVGILPPEMIGLEVEV